MEVPSYTRASAPSLRNDCLPHPCPPDSSIPTHLTLGSRGDTILTLVQARVGEGNGADFSRTLVDKVAPLGNGSRAAAIAVGGKVSSPKCAYDLRDQLTHTARAALELRARRQRGKRAASMVERECEVQVVW